MSCGQKAAAEREEYLSQVKEDIERTSDETWFLAQKMSELYDFANSGRLTREEYSHVFEAINHLRAIIDSTTAESHIGVSETEWKEILPRTNWQ